MHGLSGLEGTARVTMFQRLSATEDDIETYAITEVQKSQPVRNHTVHH